MVRLESFGGAEGAGTSGRLMRNAGGRTRRFGLDTGRSVPNWFDPYIHGGEVTVEKSRVRLVILLQLVHILCYKRKRDRGSDVGGIFASELQELIVKG